MTAATGVASPGCGDAERLSVRLAAPPDFRLLDLGGIAADVVVTATEQRRLESLHFDTRDLRLVRWGVSIRHRPEEGWTVGLPDPEGRRRSIQVADDAPPRGHPKPPAGVLDLVTAYLRSAELVSVARLSTLRHLVVLRTHDGRRLAEIVDDEVSAHRGRRLAARFREVEVGVDAAVPQLLVAILDRLQTAGAGAVDPTPKLVHALGSVATDPPEIDVWPPRRGGSAGEAVRHAVAASVVRLLRHDAAIRLDDGPEAVHQARVATRRLRSDLRTFGELVDSDWGRALRDELRWLGSELGALRDAEVLVERLTADLAALDADDAHAGRGLVERLDAEVESARTALLVGLRSARYVALLDRLVDAAVAPKLTPAAALPATEALPGLVRRPWRRLRRQVSDLGGDAAEATDDQLHTIRIAAKRVRYAAEAIAPVSGRLAARLGRAAAELQGILGEHHDAVVALHWLRANGSVGEAAFAAGQLAAAQSRAAARCRRRWRRSWRGLRAARPTRWS